MGAAKAYSVSDRESEEKILSALMGGNRGEIETIFESVRESDFYYEGNRQLFRLFLGMYERGESVSLSNALTLYKSQMEDIKTPTSFVTISTLYTTMMPFSTKDEKRIFVQSAIDGLKKRAAYRALQGIMQQTANDMRNDIDPDAIYAALEKAILERSPLAAKIERLTPQEIGITMLDVIKERMDKDKRAANVIFTSFKRLNQHTGGFEKGDLIILSAPSGTGKSALAMNFIRDVGYISNRPSLYLNSEMSKEQIVLRFASIISGVPYGDLRQGKNIDGTFGEFEKLQGVSEKFAVKSVYLTTIPDLQIAKVASELRREVERHGIEFAVVDYIGRMDSLKDRKAEEWQVMEQAARLLKTLAQELNIVVVMVAQLTDSGRLAKSSNMKNEADLWLNLQRVTFEELKERYPRAENLHLWNMILETKKARNVDSSCDMLLKFHGDTLTFTDDPARAKRFLEEERPPYFGA